MYFFSIVAKIVVPVGLKDANRSCKGIAEDNPWRQTLLLRTVVMSQ